MSSKYQAYKDRFARVDVPEPSEIAYEFDTFDWLSFVSTAPAEVFVPEFLSIIDVEGKETPFERKMRMLRQLSGTCIACSMCELGLKGAEKSNTVRDPHVLSNMNPSRFMIVMDGGSRWGELCDGRPKLDDEIVVELAKYGLFEDMFYICRTVRCYGDVNAEHFAKCSAFLRIEFNLIKPVLVMIFHEAAFASLCPNESFIKFTIVKSDFGVNVLPISSLNKIKSLSELIYKLQSKTND